MAQEAIVIIETISMVLLAVLTSEIANTFSISTKALFLLAEMVVSLMTYMKLIQIHLSPTQEITFRQILPKTTVELFSFGMFPGVIIGALAPIIFPGMPIPMPTWITTIFNQPIEMTYYEAMGIILSSLACILIALLVNGRLAGALFAGYGVAFATATVINQPINGIFYTYLGQGLAFGLGGLALIIIEPGLGRFRKSVTE